MGIGSFPGLKRPWRDFDHPPPSSADVKEIVELYIYSPFGHSWPVLWWNLPLPLPLPYLPSVTVHFCPFSFKRQFFVGHIFLSEEWWISCWSSTRASETFWTSAMICSPLCTLTLCFRIVLKHRRLVSSNDALRKCGLVLQVWAKSSNVVALC
jgi:hypothetical protein